MIYSTSFATWGAHYCRHDARSFCFPPGRFPHKSVPENQWLEDGSVYFQLCWFHAGWYISLKFSTLWPIGWDWYISGIFTYMNGCGKLGKYTPMDAMGSGERFTEGSQGVFWCGNFCWPFRNFPWKSMVGKCIFYWNSAFFKGHVSFRGCYTNEFYRLAIR